ncbi:type II secretion system protein N [Ideonella livida]|uniref:Type II secretion system protein N n=1 Tax=Ideonella livida TaxID=2707176 RepID=A0A7C9TKF4_9BURK|nr:type II secretion system protein N [Ideonella livida]NDY92779.1 type II secretion system protein N [Ideonella livida]
MKALRWTRRPPSLPATTGVAARPRPRRPGGRRSRLVVGTGALTGLLLAGVLCWPAAWTVDALSRATDGRVQLLDAQGPWWAGSALPLLTGGPGSRDAMMLPARLGWRLGWSQGGLTLHLQQPGHLPEGSAVRLRPGWGRLQVALELPAQAPARWPAAWLQGLGAPWNTLKLAGQVQLASQGFALDLDRKGWQAQGALELQLRDTASSLATVAPLGSYRVRLEGQGPQGLQVQLQTLQGALQLSGSGTLGPRGLKFRGSATAAEAQAPALNNLLNLLGRRQGAQSVLSIG